MANAESPHGFFNLAKARTRVEGKLAFHEIFVSDERFGLFVRSESEMLSEEIQYFIDANNLSVGLSLRNEENTILHADIAIGVMEYMVLEARESGQSPITFQHISLGFSRYREYIMDLIYPEGVSRHRVDVIGLSVSDLLRRLYPKANWYISRSMRMPQEILAPWIAQWQPRIWEELPLQTIK